MQTAYLLGVDFGTESVRAGLVDAQGRVVASAAEGYPTYFPRPAWAEQEPADWWRAGVAAIRACLAQSGVASQQVVGICLDATSATVMAVDGNAQPLRRAILWMDTRAAEEVELIAGTGHPVLKYAGGQADAEWMLPKALWLKRHEPRIYDQADKIVENIDWLTHRLTGEWTLSMCNTTEVWNYVPPLGGWSADFLTAIGLGDILEKWPEPVLYMGDLAGRLLPDVAAELGLPAGIPVAEGGVDSHIGMIGVNALRPGQLGMTAGSSTVHLTLSREPLFIPGIWGPYAESIVRGLWLLEGGQVSTGSIVRWYQQQFFPDAGEGLYRRLDEEAARIPPGSDGLVLLDYWQGNRTPLRDARARGAIVGLSLSHTRAHIFRAILEGAAYGTAHVLRAFAEGGATIEEVIVSGGHTRSALWMQIYADVCNKPLYLTQVAENSMLGCAVCAAVAAGLYGTVEEAATQMVHRARCIEPDAARHEIYKSYFEQYLRAYPGLKGVMHALAAQTSGEQPAGA